MKFYVSFGQAHVHSINGHTIDKDCIVEIESDSREKAHRKVMDMFDGVFCFLHNDMPDMSYFPRGIIKLWRE